MAILSYDTLKDSIAANKPYDVWVKEMLSSTGPMWERGNGAVGYFYRDQGMGLDNMANTVRVFLGTSLECAQCHDHPFDRWTQKQFYEMAAFTNGVGNVARKNEELRKLNQMARAAQKENEEERNQIRRAFEYQATDILDPGLDDLGKGSIALPKDYQYDNAKPGEKLEAKTIFGLVVELDENLEEKGSRHLMPVGLPPRTTRVLYRHSQPSWKTAFGIGLIEPVDNMYDDTLPTDPKLPPSPRKLMVALQYDTKEFLRIVYNTKAFQRAAPIREINSRDTKDESFP